MKQKTEITTAECIEMDLPELISFSGGSMMPTWMGSLVKGMTPVAVGLWLMNNWSDVKKGLSDGWDWN